jgi:ferric-dicitrate binding protein FerR (iron transport regulator)
MEIDRNILVRYFLEQCSEDEKTAIRQWLESDETHKRQFISERIRFDASLVIDENALTTQSPNYPKQLVLNVLKIAAAVLLLIGSSYFFNLIRQKQPDIIMQHIYVPDGNRASLTLPDGTQVWLNSNSSLIYPNCFPVNERVIELNGEAWFEVAKSDRQPFIVKTHKYNIEVLGTTFDLEAYDDQPEFAVTLISGKIKLYNGQRKDNIFFLNPGEIAELENDTIRISAANIDNYRWMEGLIVIDNKSFEEIMRLFEKYFDYRIVIKNENVKRLGYRGKLRIADGVDHALSVLRNDFRFTYKRNDDTKTIYIY